MKNENFDETMPVSIPPHGTEQPEPGEPDPGNRQYESEPESSMDETMPVPTSGRGTDIPVSPSEAATAPQPQTGEGTPGQPPPIKTSRRKRPSWVVYTVLGFLALVLVGGISAFGGYTSGISMRRSAERTQVSHTVDEQFLLGVQEMDQGEYFRARQRFEYVIQMNPEYPGAMEKLADVLLEMNTTATPTLVPTPTLTPTPDVRGVQELLDQSQQYLLNTDWDNAIETLLALRKVDAQFQTVTVDGMLFLALRNRGRDKIINQADLEGGIYDLTLASRFGFLDAEAKGLLSWASLYITGASFWEIDWGQAAYYFGQVAPHLPNLRDGSGLTAAERYRTSLFNYAKLLAQSKRWCDAAAQLEIALSIASDPELEQAYAEMANKCANQQKPPPEALPTTSP